MRKAPMIVIASFLMLALALPALAGNSAGAGNVLYRVSNEVYSGGTSVLAETEHHVTEILRNTFGLFNPCLDLVKGCSRVVFAPLELPFDMMTQTTAKPIKVRVRDLQKIPVPEKPKMPSK